MVEKDEECTETDDLSKSSPVSVFTPLPVPI